MSPNRIGYAWRFTRIQVASCNLHEVCCHKYIYLECLGHLSQNIEFILFSKNIYLIFLSPSVKFSQRKLQFHYGKSEFFEGIYIIFEEPLFGLPFTTFCLQGHRHKDFILSVQATNWTSNPKLHIFLYHDLQSLLTGIYTTWRH